jgi:hypothetical protein
VRLVVPVHPGRFARASGLVVVLLLAASLAGQLHARWIGESRTRGLAAFVDVNREENLPTAVSTLALLLASGLAAAIAAERRRAAWRQALGWMGLAVIFAYLAVDEIGRLHERYRLPWTTAPRSMAEARVAPWIVIGVVVVVVVGLTYLPFLACLPSRTRARFVAAGIAFVGGAIGVELLDDLLVAGGVYSKRGFLHAVATTVEEGLEMAGVLVYLHAQLDYVVTVLGGARARLPGGRLEVVLEPSASLRGASPPRPDPR